MRAPYPLPPQAPIKPWPSCSDVVKNRDLDPRNGGTGKDSESSGSRSYLHMKSVTLVSSYAPRRDRVQ